jgi:GT2 family glycosyltransferase/tetratricopeptide (TPR) repeat protein
MIVTMIPYCPTSQGMDLGFAYNQLMERIGEDDWACFIDHDACFTTRDWYAQLERIVAAAPEPCLLTCRTNRVGSPWQRVPGIDPNHHGMDYHRQIGSQLAGDCGERLTDVTMESLMSGVVILLSKRTWRLLGGFTSGFLGVDNRLHERARQLGARVFLMEGVYVYHWYRADQDQHRSAASIVRKSAVPSPPMPLGAASAPQSLASADTAVHDVLARLIPEHVRQVALVESDDGLASELQTRGMDVRCCENCRGACRKGRQGCSDDLVSCLVGGDAFARSRDAEMLLRDWRSRLQTGGSLLLVVPNVARRSVVEGLLAGTWNAAETSADRPIRFFTRRELEKLLFRTGFELEALENVCAPKLTGDGRCFLATKNLAPQVIERLETAAFAVRARAVETPRFGLTSIVLVTFNQLGYTHGCLESIRARTDLPCELIVIDNGSTDGTVDYLRGQADIRLITNDRNRGFPAAANQGLQVAMGEQVVLLNNDTLVTTGWLEHLLEALYSDPSVGLVGPTSNAVSGAQCIAVDYADLASLDGFAWEWGKTHRQQTEVSERLVGFCLVMRREVVDRIGLLDERFGVGNFEDDDYCRRARAAGYRCLVARAAFVHHFGHVSFHAAGIDLSQVLQDNERLYQEKWGSSESFPTALPAPAAENAEPATVLTICAGTTPGLRLAVSRLRVSLVLICRNNQGTIRACLESIRPWVDEMVVVDTGSTDKTPQIAEELGARLFHFPWCDSFSAARNESLRHARGEWVFWMDSDDTIDADNGRKLREFVDGLTSDSAMGHVLQVHCPGGGEDGSLDVTAVDHVKLFRNRADLRFEFRVHEQILPAIRRAGGGVGWTDLFVVHSGSDHSSEGRQRKQARDLRLLELDLAERPDHPFVLFNLGMTYADMDQHEEAARYLQRCVQVSGETESHLRKAYALYLGSLMQLERFQEAGEVCQAGQRLFSDDPELWFRRGILDHRLKRFTEAVHAYRQVLGYRGERHFASIDRGIVGFKTRHNLALVFEDQGDWLQAEEQWRLAVGEVPGYRDGWRGLFENLLHQRKFSAVEELLERLRSQPRWLPEVRRLEALLAQARGDYALARHCYDAGLKLAPEDLLLRRTRCQFLFERGSLAEAEQALAELIELDPADTSARHNLGTICLRQGRSHEAAAFYRQAIELGSRTPESRLYLAFALEQLGERHAAQRECEQLLRQHPAHQQAAEALARLRSAGSALAV